MLRNGLQETNFSLLAYCSIYIHIYTHLHIHTLFTGGFLTCSCEHGVVYAIKALLRGESPRDHVDLLLSLKYPPNVVINDVAGMTAAHMNKRSPGFFNPHSGRLAEGTEENISLAEKKLLTVNLPFLEETRYTMPKASTSATDHAYSQAMYHPVTGTAERYCLTDEFHKKNVRTKIDKLRECSLVPQIGGRINTQVEEQLFRSTVRDLYFVNMLSPANYMFMVRLLFHLHNKEKNMHMENSMMQNCSKALGNCSLSTDHLGRLRIEGIRNEYI